MPMPTARHGFVAESVGNFVYTFGGGKFDGGGTSDTVEVYHNQSLASLP